MKKPITECNVLCDAGRMQSEGTPIEIGKIADFAIASRRKKPEELAGINIDFFEDTNKGTAIIRGEVIGIKVLAVEEYADKKERNDNPKNTFAVFDSSYIDGYSEYDDYGEHPYPEVVYYIITLADAMVGKYKRDLSVSDNKDVCMDFVVPGRFSCSKGPVIGDTTGINIVQNGEKSRIVFPKEIQDRLNSWVEDYMAHIHEEVWCRTKKFWDDWYLNGWVTMKLIKELLPKGIRLFYGDKGLSRGVIDQDFDVNVLKSSGRLIQIVNDMKDKIKEGAYIPKALLDRSYDNDARHKYKFSIPKNQHHLFPSDMVVLKALGWPISEGNILAKVLFCEDDGIIVQAYDWVEISEEYSIELID